MHRPLFACLVGLGLVLEGCVPAESSPPTSPYGPVASAPAAAAPPPPLIPQPIATPAVTADPIAVLPIHDDELFRAERTELRAELARALQARVPERKLLPFTEVDAALRPVTKSGARCAHGGVHELRRASNRGWLATELRVVGGEDRKTDLWVELMRDTTTELLLIGEWNAKLPTLARYRTAFATLTRRSEDAMLLGGLGLSGSRAGSVTVGSLTLCEAQGFGACSAETRAFSDRATDLARCFSAVDAARETLLFEGGARCEIADLDDVTSPRAKREACMCAALSKSATLGSDKRRRTLELAYEAADLLAKPRPELRVVDASTNLHVEADWHTVPREQGGKITRVSIRRLSVDNLDALALPLARCREKPGTVLIAELELAQDGRVTRARVVGARAGRDVACIEKALSQGAFACTDDDKPARLRVALDWSR